MRIVYLCVSAWEKVEEVLNLGVKTWMNPFLVKRSAIPDSSLTSRGFQTDRIYTLFAVVSTILRISTLILLSRGSGL